MKNLYITKKQEYLMNIIVNQLGAIIDGELNRINASKFISDNIDFIDINKGNAEFNNYNKYYNFPTEKQWKAIFAIENKHNIKFDGTTFEDAKLFIKEYSIMHNSSTGEIKKKYNYNDCDSNDRCNSFNGVRAGYTAREIEDTLNAAIFFSGGVNIYGGCEDFMYTEL